MQLTISKKEIISNWLGSLFTLLALILFFYFQPTYLQLDFTLLLGLMVSPFVCRKVNSQLSFRFLSLAIGIATLLFFLPSNSLYYFLWISLLLLGIEGSIGRLNNLPIFLLIILSYLVQQVLNNWSFPIRLQLSEWVGTIIHWLGYQASVAGNIIYLDGNPFSVDPACMGLNMIVTALILSLVILAYWERKMNKVFSFFQIGGCLILVAGLTILSNFVRIISLVLFQIPPESIFHDVIGIVSLALYTLLPAYWIIGKYVSVLNLNSSNKKQTVRRKRVRHSMVIYSSLLLLLAFHGQQLNQFVPESSDAFPLTTFQDFQSTQISNGMIKLENDSTLIYIKPPVRFYQGSHDPKVCWSGEGYTFENIQVEYIQDIPVYTATLQFQEEELYTAWWYDNLQTTTIEQWQWRWEALQGKARYYLVNVSSVKKEQLIDQVRTLLANK